MGYEYQLISLKCILTRKHEIHYYVLCLLTVLYFHILLSVDIANVSVSTGNQKTPKILEIMFTKGWLKNSMLSEKFYLMDIFYNYFLKISLAFPKNSAWAFTDQDEVTF